MLPIILTYTGKRVHLLEPDPDTIFIEDIAHHLSMQNRFNGATAYPYSVAAHSLYMAKYLVEPEYALQALMHDATEAYIGDMVKPLKDSMPEFEEVEAVLWEVLAEKYELPPELHESVHEADRLACRIEHFYLRGTKGLQIGELTEEAALAYPNLTRGPWQHIKWEFLDMFEELQP